MPFGLALSMLGEVLLRAHCVASVSLQLICLVEHIGHFGSSSLVVDMGTPQSYGQLSALSI